MPAPLLWAVGFAIGIAAWVALLWLLVVGAQSMVGSAAAGYRELRLRLRAAEEDRAVAVLDAVRADREERIRRRAAARGRLAA